MIITALIWVSLVFVLFVLAGVSIYLAYSGYLPGRTYVGWITLGLYLAIFFVFAEVWAGKLHASSLFVIAFLVFLLALQVPLVLELLSLMVMGDPSKGLRLLKAYSVPERKIIQGDLTGGIAEYERIIAKDPDDVTACFRLAELYYQKGEYHQALRTYEALLSRAKKLDTDQHCTGLTRLAEIYARHFGDIEKARAFIQTIIESYPGTKYADFAAEYLNRLPSSPK